VTGHVACIKDMRTA